MTAIDAPHGAASKGRSTTQKPHAKKPASGSKKDAVDAKAESGDGSESSTEKSDAAPADDKSGHKADSKLKGKVSEKGSSMNAETSENTVLIAPGVNQSSVGSAEDAKVLAAQTGASDARHVVLYRDFPRIVTVILPVSSAPKVVQTPATEVSHEIKKFDWLDDSVYKRLQAAVAWQKPQRSIYPISSVHPAATTFGNSRDMLLCYKGKPLSVSFVARLMSTYFRVGDQGNRYPARYANVRFKFMRDVDEQVCRALVHAKAKPAEVFTRKSFWAGSKRTVWNKQTGDSDLFDFTEVYDGSSKVTSLHKMAKLDNSELHPNDILLLECQINRFTEGGSDRYVGSTWTTRLRLIRIVRLFAAPANATEDPPSEEESKKPKEPVVESDDDDMGF